MDIKNRVNPESKQEIFKIITLNALNRNTHLKNLFTIFDSISSPIVLSVDGGWGSGKTIFLKQFEYLANCDEITLPDEFKIKTFKENNTVFYFDAWQNDIYKNPLEALLFNLINHFEKAKNPIIDLASAKILGKTLLNIFMKLGTAGAIDSSDLMGTAFEKTDPFESITTTDEIKQKMNELLSEITKEKKLIIVIDELDRCKPTFAIELLEVIKHYFNHNNVHFLICSNKAELEHTVRNVYGQKFNGYEYLDRFIDLEYNLPAPNVSNYVKLFNDEIPFESLILDAINHFNLSLRQINKYLLYTELSYSVYKDIEGSFSTVNEIDIIFAYYLIGLKFKSLNNFNEFIAGNGLDKFNIFFEKTKKYQINMDTNFAKKVNQEYETRFVNKDEYSYRNKNSDFFKILSFIK